MGNDEQRIRKFGYSQMQSSGWYDGGAGNCGKTKKRAHKLHGCVASFYIRKSSVNALSTLFAIGTAIYAKKSLFGTHSLGEKGKNIHAYGCLPF